MSEDLAEYDDELNKIYAEVQKGIKDMGKLKSNDKANKGVLLQDRITRAKHVYKSYKVEIRYVSKSEALEWQEKAKKHNEMINKLINDLDWSNRDALLEGGNPPKSVDQKTADEVLDQAANTQQKSLASADGMISTMESIKQIGADGSAALSSQTKQLEHAIEGTRKVQDNLKMAQKQLRAFARRMATDKLIMILMLFVVLGIIGVIVVSIVKPHSNTNVPDTFKPNG